MFILRNISQIQYLLKIMVCLIYFIHSVACLSKSVIGGKITVKKTKLHLERLVRAEKLQLLFDQSFLAIPVSFLIAVLVSVILWPVQQTSVLLTWLITIAVIAIGRTLLFVLYWRAAPEEEQVLAWEKPYFISLTFATTAWGAGAVFIMPVDSVFHQAVIYFFLTGMAGGSISLYSAHRSMTLVTLAILLLPATAWLLMQDNLVLVVMAVGGLIFFITVTRSGKVLSMKLNQSFMLAHELKMAKEKAEKLALVDELSGLENRRAFYEKGGLLVEYCQRNGKLLALIVMDIDQFKNINDNYGHTAGDEAIRQVGRLIKELIRKSDIGARVGGEEFAILLEVSDHEGAELLANKLLKIIISTPVVYKDGSFTISASFGVSVCDCDLETLFQRADEALYRAKDAGRSCVVVDGCGVERQPEGVKVELAP